MGWCKVMFEELDDFNGILEDREKAREELLKLARLLRIKSTKAISAIHSGDLETSEGYLNEAKKTLKEIQNYQKYPQIYYPITHDAMQEFVESWVFLKLVKDPREDIFGFDETNFITDGEVEIPAVLTGLADLIGELRRYVLDIFRKGEFEKSERYIEIMEALYYRLSTFYFPDKLVPGLRHKVDRARLTIEKTKSDYITARLTKAIEGEKEGD